MKVKAPTTARAANEHNHTAVTGGLTARPFQAAGETTAAREANAAREPASVPGHDFGRVTVGAGQPASERRRPPVVQLKRRKNRRRFKNQRQAAHRAKMEGQTQQHERGLRLPYDVVGESHTVNPLGAEEAREMTGQFVDDNDRPLARNQIPEGELGLDKDNIGYVDPHRLRTMHHGIDERFSSGKKISETADLLRSGALKTEKVPPTALFFMRERELPWTREDPLAPRNMTRTNVYSADHRRVLAHRLADKPIRYRMGNEEEAGTIRGKYTTRTQGLKMEVRSYHDQQEGAHQRSNVSTRGRYRLDPKPKIDKERDHDARAQFKELPRPGHKNRLPALYQFIKHFGGTPTGMQAEREAAELRRGRRK